MSERDKWEQIINDWATLQISSGQLADIIISARNSSVKKVCEPLKEAIKFYSNCGMIGNSKMCNELAKKIQEALFTIEEVTNE